YLKGKPKLGLWYPRVSSFDLEAYSDNDYVGANLDRKSTTGEAEYVAAANCCRQVLWIQNQMLDYGFNFMNIKIYIDNESTICIVKNLVFHSKTKHIEIRHHFIRDAYKKKLIQVLKIHTDDNVADLLTKAFDVSRLRATYGAELVSAATLVNTTRPTLSTTQLVDFLTSSLIHHALTAVVTEASIRSSLFLNDADGTACQNLDTPKKKFLMYPRFLMAFLNNQIELGEPFNDVYVTPAHTQKVFANMSKKGVKFSRKITPLFDYMLVQHQAPKGEGSEQPTKPQPTPSPTQPSIGDPPSSHDATQDSRNSLEGTNVSEGDHVQSSHDSPLLGGPTFDRAEGGMNLEKLSILCTNLSKRVFALEVSKDAQAAEIIKLKTRIKKLKKKSHLVISHHRAWLRSVSGLSMKRKLGRKESVSKQGRKNGKPRPILDDSTFDDLDADNGMDYMDTEEPVNKGRLSKETEELNVTHDKEVLEKGGSNKEPVSAAGNTGVSTVVPDIGTATPMTPPTTTSVFEDEDIFLVDVLNWKKEKEERQRQEQAFVDYIANLYDEVQAKMDASEELAARLQMEEREMYTVEERSRLLAEYFENRKKQLAVERSTAIRNKPPTRSQLRSLMMTYLKHTDFMPIGSEEEERMTEKMNEKVASEDTSNKEKVLKEPDNTKVEVKQEGNTESTRKRPGRRLKMKATKKSKRYGKPHDYYRVFRADGSSIYIKTFTEMVSRFDRLDFIELHSLVMKRFETSTAEGINLILWGSLRTIVHILVLEDGTNFYMLVERRYPLTKKILERMLALRLIVESKSEAVFDLLRFIQMQIDESRSHDGTCYCNEALAIPEQMTTDSDKDWKPKNAKDDKVTKEFKFIKEQIKE
ncbi:hypothetical protein Tco_0901113, partial [Tanacetum coccineum]